MDANQNRTRQKTGKLTGDTSNGGRFSFPPFFVRTKKGGRFTEANQNKKSMDSPFQGNDSTATPPGATQNKH